MALACGLLDLSLSYMNTERVCVCVCVRARARAQVFQAQ